MAGKQSGLAAGCWLDQYDVSGDVGSLQNISNSRGILEDNLTGIDKLAFERLHGHRNGAFEFTAGWNDAAGQSHPATKDVTVGTRIASYLHRQTLGASAASCACLQSNVTENRSEAGDLLLSVTAVANSFGLEWGNLLTAGVRTDTAATNGASVDRNTIDGATAATAFGGQAYLHVFSFTGTSVAIKIQDSTNDSAWNDLPGAAFATVTGPTKERVQTARTENVDRYLRVVTTGTFSSAVFGVIFVRNQILTNF